MLLKKLHFKPVVVFKKLERHSFSQKKSARCELFSEIKLDFLPVHPVGNR